MAAACAVCGGKRAHPIHVKAVNMDGYHEHQDASRAGLQPISAARRAYLASDEHKEAYGVAEAYCVGHALDAPGRCSMVLTPHHTMKRSVGGQKFAEANAPVVTLCTYLNDGIESDQKIRAWALATKFTRNGVAYPFLVLAKDVAK